MDFLDIRDKTFLVTGVANRKSVAWHVARLLSDAGARVVYSVRSDARRESLAKLVGDAPIYVCDVEFEDQIAELADAIKAQHAPLAGMVHSIALADYEDGVQPFHHTSKRAFLRSLDISCYSLVALSRAFRAVMPMPKIAAWPKFSQPSDTHVRVAACS